MYLGEALLFPLFLLALFFPPFFFSLCVSSTEWLSHPKLRFHTLFPSCMVTHMCVFRINVQKQLDIHLHLNPDYKMHVGLGQVDFAVIYLLSHKVLGASSSFQQTCPGHVSERYLVIQQICTCESTKYTCVRLSCLHVQQLATPPYVSRPRRGILFSLVLCAFLIALLVSAVR